MQTLADLLGAPAERTCMVGDDVHLEVRMGREAGAPTVLVLSGTSTRADIESVATEHRPHLVLENVGELLPHLR
jgi:NagD protein